MEFSTLFAYESSVLIARIGLIVFGMSLSYFWRMWALNDSLTN